MRRLRRRVARILLLTFAGSAILAAPLRAQTVTASGVDSVRVRANVQAQFNTTSADAEADSEWLLRRARLGIAAYAGGWLYTYVEGDFGRGDAQLTDGYVTLRFDPRLELRAGQFKVPFDELELITSRELPVVERDPLPRGATGFTPNGLLDDLGYNARDIGADWNGRFDRVRATAGVFNGQGDNEDELDDGKQVAARLEAEVAVGWRVAGAWTGLRLSDPPAATEAAWYQAVELAVRGGEYAKPGPQVLGQIFFGDDHDPVVLGDDDASFFAWQAIAGWHVATYDTPFLIGWEPIVRAGQTRIEDGSVVVDDVMVDLSDTEPSTTVLTGGINLYWKERIRTQLQVDWVSFDGGGELEDSDDVALRIQTGFGF
ncbi:MAG TPA: porin [Gemmatimonadota bacterium]|nr:porin [Gemmatimonadota bacterium]